MTNISAAEMTNGFEYTRSESYRHINRFKQQKNNTRTTVAATSPLNVEGLTLGFSSDEIVNAVRESRARYAL